MIIDTRIELHQAIRAVRRDSAPADVRTALSGGQIGLTQSEVLISVSLGGRETLIVTDEAGTQHSISRMDFGYRLSGSQDAGLKWVAHFTQRMFGLRVLKSGEVSDVERPLQQPVGSESRELSSEVSRELKPQILPDPSEPTNVDAWVADQDDVRERLTAIFEKYNYTISN